MTQKGTGRRGISRLASHPVVTLISLTVGVLGTVLAVVFYLKSQVSPDLRYYVSAGRTQIARVDETPFVKLLYKGDEVKGGVTACQLTLWNAGNAPIRPDSVLEPIKVISEPRVRILDVYRERLSRQLIDFEYGGEESWGSGEIPLNWRILEHGDGATLQIIYAGKPSVRFFLEGTIEKQGTPSGIDAAAVPGVRTGISHADIVEDAETRRLLLPAGGGAVVLILLLSGHAIVKELRRDFRKTLLLRALASLAVLGFFLYFIWRQYCQVTDILSFPSFAY